MLLSCGITRNESLSQLPGFDDRFCMLVFVYLSVCAGGGSVGRKATAKNFQGKDVQPTDLICVVFYHSTVAINISLG